MRSLELVYLVIWAFQAVQQVQALNPVVHLAFLQKVQILKMLKNTYYALK